MYRELISHYMAKYDIQPLRATSCWQPVTIRDTLLFHTRSSCLCPWCRTPLPVAVVCLFCGAATLYKMLSQLTLNHRILRAIN